MNEQLPGETAQRWRGDLESGGVRGGPLTREWECEPLPPDGQCLYLGRGPELGWGGPWALPKLDTLFLSLSNKQDICFAPGMLHPGVIHGLITEPSQRDGYF